MRKAGHIRKRVYYSKKSPSVTTANDDLSDYDDILTVDLEPALEVNWIVANKFPKRLYATIDVGKKQVCFQLNSGASCNVISEETLKNCLGPVKLEQTKQVLSMLTWDQALFSFCFENYIPAGKRVYENR